MIANRSILAVWAVVVVAFSLSYGVVTWEEYLHQWQDVIVLGLSYILPSVWVGWQVIRGKRWAVWLSAAVSTLNILLLTNAVLNGSILFGELHLDIDPFFAFTVLVMLLMCSFIQLFLLICAVVAGRKPKQLPAA